MGPVPFYKTKVKRTERRRTWWASTMA